MDKYEEYALIFKALSDKTRLNIIEMLSCGEMCACDILEYFKITQPTLSYHMKILAGCSLVNSRKDGSWMRYSLNSEKAEAISLFWKQISRDHCNCICKTLNNKCR